MLHKGVLFLHIVYLFRKRFWFGSLSVKNQSDHKPNFTSWKWKPVFPAILQEVVDYVVNSTAAELQYRTPNFDCYPLFHRINHSDPYPTEVNVEPHTEFNAPATYFKRKHFNWFRTIQAHIHLAYINTLWFLLPHHLFPSITFLYLYAQSVLR